MKKLFFFKSSSRSGNNSVSPPSTEKKVHSEKQNQNPPGSGVNNQAVDKSETSFRSSRGFLSKSGKQQFDGECCGASSALRRSRSLSSTALFADGMGQKNFSRATDQSRSPSSSTTDIFPKQSSRSSGRYRALTPERHSWENRFEVSPIQSAPGTERPGSSGSSRSHNDSSGNSSLSSSNVSTKILDRYIDGEQHQERSGPTNSSSQRNYSGNVNGGCRLPPRVQYATPASPTDNVKGKSHSFRDAKDTSLYFSSRDWVENGFGHESPRRLAKNVVERLSQTHVLPRSHAKEFDHGVPITIEEIYGGSFSRCSDSNSDVVARGSYSLDEPSETVNGYHKDDFLVFQKQNCFPGDNCEGFNTIDIEEDVDVNLQRRSKEAEERVLVLSEELEQETFIRDCGFDVSTLIQTIKRLTEEKLSLAYEVSGLLQSRIAERASTKEELRLVKADVESQTQRLGKEKHELQLELEKELDRRSSEWSLKLEKYQMEEHRLRERVRELAEHNVSLQRKVSSFKERETESRNMITHSEKQLKDLNIRIQECSEENRDLRGSLSELQKKFRATEEDLDCFKRNFKDKEMECKELQKSLTRLLRTCSEQEKTIAALQEEFSEGIENKKPSEKFDRHVARLQMEQMRLTGVELSLRREAESYRLEVNSLRNENITLLHRLKDNGQESGALTIKLDKELWMRICCLQNQGLSMLNESAELCPKLLEFIKGKSGKLQDNKQGIESIKNGLDGQFIVESDMKIQSLKRGIESLTRSLQTMSGLLHEKSNLVASKCQFLNTEADCSGKMNNQTPEENIRSELKAETLLTNLLREKLYSKELEVQQLQAELATAVRGNDILRCEAQNALDNISCMTHKLKDLENQILKKDESIGQLQSDLQDSSKELHIIKGILPKVSEERDMMWDEVKQYSEKNMQLNLEVNALRKKIESLDDDILVKEGQITILKDSLGNKHFDLLGSPDTMNEFLLN
ncbi:cingulin-like [Mangifera indica]|uniref:cingulin-like n=1 Tax=Mangifera indica TaxID=29780 RepID=UPI001CFC2B7D|nr:cingulin-like [Mangifera indica]XP_044509846.1 cingulin-like [Mangifera indica]XP_044509847.1 cingulin-like [Mangifera indica]XP_044509848.1 cingulin-like [Mangifera indica]